jgi:formylglycine-generating enzyme required for sulfatase activity
VDGYSSCSKKLKLGKFYKNRRSKSISRYTVWIKDFAYSYNEPMHNDYFWHKAYGDYPVVGVKWTQAKAFVLGEH